MLVTWLASTTAVLLLFSAAFAWRDYRKARLQWRRRAFLTGAVLSVIAAVMESCIAIWG
jgi:hypothetical protein